MISEVTDLIYIISIIFLIINIYITIYKKY